MNIAVIVQCNECGNICVCRNFPLKEIEDIKQEVMCITEKNKDGDIKDSFFENFPDSI
jgi:hypothetical protein